MRRPLRPTDLYLLRQVTDCDLHPDGRRAAYVVSWCDEATDSNRAQLWLHDGAETSRPLTYGHADHTPRFSPDGRWLAYLSAEPKAPPQLRVLPTDGGEGLTLTRFDDGAGEPVWLTDSSGLVVVAATRPPDQQGLGPAELAERPRPRRIDTTQYRFNGRGWTHDRRRHLFLVRLPVAGAAAPSPVQLTDGPWDDTAPAPSPDGRRVAFVSARHDDREWTGGNDVWLVGIDGGDARPVTADGVWAHLRWLPDGERLVALGHPRRQVVRLATPHVLDVDVDGDGDSDVDGAARRVGNPRPLGDGEVTAGSVLYGNGPRSSVVGRRLYVYGARRGALHVDAYDLDNGARETVVGGRRTVGSWAVSGDGQRIVYSASGSNTPAELHSWTAAGGEERLTTVTAPFLEEVELGELEEVELAAADGHPVHAFVCRPPAGAPPPASDGRRPGIVYVHGGPLSQYGWGFFDEFQMAAADGHVVVGGNPRGSDGYGPGHASSIVGDLGNRDWLDVQAIADHLAGLPDVDAARIGIGGGSYGGFMTGWAIGHTDRFAAALSERAVNNWVTMEATSDIGWFVGAYCGTTTFDDIEALRRQSPITHAPAIATPTLVIHSEEDWRCPPEQAEQLFAALRRKGVACAFVRFPGENHELTRSGRPSLRIERFTIVAEWWAGHLAATAVEQVPAAVPAS